MSARSTDDLVRSMAGVRDEKLAGFADRPAARNLMRDIVALAPAEEARAGRQVAGRSRAEEPGRSRRRFRVGPGVPLVAAGALAAVTVGAVALGPGADGPPPPATTTIALGSAAEASYVLGRAAKAAEQREFTPPRPDQWVYTKMRHTASAEPSGGVTGGPYKTVTEELWRRVDGKQYAAYKDGKLQTGHETEKSSKVSLVDPLPDDPDELLRKFGGGEGHYDLAFDMLITILRESVHSPETEAAVYRAMQRIPGVAPVKGAVDIGRSAIALGRTVDGWLHEEVLLDSKTYAYLGERAITIKTRTVENEGEDTRTVQAGTLARLIVRDAIAVVDEPGQRP